jgi:hypothetical protein
VFLFKSVVVNKPLVFSSTSFIDTFSVCFLLAFFSLFCDSTHKTQILFTLYTQHSFVLLMTHCTKFTFIVCRQKTKELKITTSKKLFKTKQTRRLTNFLSFSLFHLFIEINFYFKKNFV